MNIQQQFKCMDRNVSASMTGNQADLETLDIFAPAMR